MVKAVLSTVNGKSSVRALRRPRLGKGVGSGWKSSPTRPAPSLRRNWLSARADRSARSSACWACLERRGYLVRERLTGRYSLTLKLFVLGNRHQPTRRLQAAALPVMQELAEAVGQSCHLVVATENADDCRRPSRAPRADGLHGQAGR